MPMKHFILLLFAVAVLSSPTHAVERIKPINLPCNTKADEDEPHAASNGLVLYYVSNAKGRFAGTERARRDRGHFWSLFIRPSPATR